MRPIFFMRPILLRFTTTDTFEGFMTRFFSMLSLETPSLKPQLKASEN